MYVKDKMSTDLTFVRPNTSISETLYIMDQTKHIRIPVVDDDGNCVGIVTESVIKEYTPNNANSLSIYELNYLLNKYSVKDIMIKDFVYIDKDSILEKAADVMNDNNVTILPVLEEGKKIIGVITHNDIFKAFVELLGYHQKGTRYVINIPEDKTGVFAKVSKCFADNNISISNVAVYNTQRGIEVVIIAIGDNSNTCKESLISLGFNVTDVREIN